MQVENPLVTKNGYGKTDPQDVKEIGCCEECCQEIYSKDDMYICTFNGDFIHQDCFDDYFKKFVK